MSNFSLMNNGTSLNFDGQELQNQQEDEYRQEEEQQQHELRQLLTDAFDDLIDEDDILSVMSDDDENSRNGSLSRSQDDRELTAGEPESCRASVDWGMQTYPGASITPSSNTDSGLVSPQYSSLAQSWDFQQHNINPQPNPAHFAFQQQPIQPQSENQIWPSDQMNMYPREQPMSEMSDRRFIQREEAEGGNSDRQGYNMGNNNYWVHHGNDGFYKNDYLEEEQPRIGLFNAPKQDAPAYPVFFTNYESSVSTHDINPGVNISYSSLEENYPNNPVYSVGHQHEDASPSVSPRKQERNVPSSPRKQDFIPPPSPRKKEYNQEYKVQYRPARCLEVQVGDERSPDLVPEKVGTAEIEEQPSPDFVHHGGSVENRELAQLQILYKARGRKLEEITSEYETLKDETAREIRILKHQLNVSKGEKEGNSNSLKECQGLLLEEKSKIAQLSGKMQALEGHNESLQKGKEEVMKKLQIAESAVEALNSQLAEVNASETLSRARHEHEVVVSSLQQRYEKEIHILKGKIDDLNSVILEKNDELTSLKKQLASSMKAYENDQISRADTINRLTRSLDDSQKQCQALLDSASSHEMSQLKVQMHQALASKSITEEMCVSLQGENKDLKEQLNMMESASLLGAMSQRSGAVSEGHDDSIADLGIRKTLDFLTPETRHTTPESSGSSEIVTGLRAELERCLSSNRQKRNELMTIKQDLMASKKEVVSLTARCERAELTLKESQVKVKEFEDLVNAGERNPGEVRLRKELENLRKEKDIILEDADDLKNRLEEIATSEQRLMEINQELKQQISTMIKDHDDDKRSSLERCKKTYEQLMQDTKDKIRDEMTLAFGEEKDALISKYETEREKLRIDLKTALREVDEVKELYVQVCEQKEKLKDELELDFDKTMKENINKIKEEMDSKRENEKDQEMLNEQAMTAKIREEMKRELGEDSKQTIETKVAMAKVEWFEEQRTAKQAAVENALKLAEIEWKNKMEDTVQEEVRKKVDEAKEQWFSEHKECVKEEVEQKVQEEIVKLSKETEAECENKIKNEQAEWNKNMEEKISNAVEKEKEIWQAKMEKLSLDMKDEFINEKKIFEEDLENRLKERLEKEKEIWTLQHETEIENERIISNKNLEEMLECEKTRFENTLEIEIQKRLEASKEMFEERLDSEIKKCLEGEKVKIDEKVEYEINLRLELEKAKVEDTVKNDMMNKFEQEKIELAERLECDIKQQFEKEIADLIKEKQMMVLQADSEKEAAVEQVRSECMKMHDAEVSDLESTWQLENNKKIEAAVLNAVNSAKEEYHREQELTQSILQAELESLKLENDELQNEKQNKEMDFMKEKEELARHKDEERKQAVTDIQDQWEKDYKKFMEDHHETLTHSLKASRDQHTKEKTDLSDLESGGILNMRAEYLCTVGKIKEDVLRHVTETNLRAAETVKTEVLKERQITWLQLKKIKENVRRILQNEILGANLETKLSEVERAISSSNPSSRSATPRSELSNISRTPTPSRMLRTPSPSKLNQGTPSSERSRSVTPTSQTNYSSRIHSVTPTSQLRHATDPQALEKALDILEMTSDNEGRELNLETFSGQFVFDKDPVWPDDDQNEKQGKYSVPVKEKREIYPHRRTASERRTTTTSTSKYNKTEQENYEEKSSENLFANCVNFNENNLNEYKHSVHKTVSEPDLSIDNARYSSSIAQHDDITIGSYRYTSLRDNLRRPTSTSPTRGLNKHSAEMSHRTNKANTKYGIENPSKRLPYTTTELPSELSAHITNHKDSTLSRSAVAHKDSGTVDSNKPKDSQRVLRSVHKSEPFIRQTVVSQGRQPVRSTGQRYQGMPEPEEPKDITLNPPSVNHTAKYSPPLIRFSRKKLTTLSQ